MRQPGSRSRPRTLAVVLGCACLAAAAPLRADGDGRWTDFAAELRGDFAVHYGPRGLADVGIGFAVTAALANSNADRWLQDRFRADLEGRAGDDLSNFFTGIGDLAQPNPAFALYLGTMLLAAPAGGPETPASLWAGDSLRATLIGMPELLLLSHVAGGHRPLEGAPGWYPFEDDEGVSGHAYFGAIPLLAAARRTERRWLRYTAYGLSTLPGLARVYDDKHYFSQAFMGWWIARAATRSVQRNNAGRAGRWRLSPVLLDGGGGVQLARRLP